MANKDGVARGGHRFNLMGVDLNRKWDCPADPELAPENTALEAWLETMVGAGRRPDLAIDLHNDGGGQLHVSRPETDAATYLADMGRLEHALREHTWFTEGSTGANFRNPGSFGEGLFERYGITACILELNCNWSAGLSKPPLGQDWRLLGNQMHDAFQAYFSGRSGGAA
jgi:predicted deacylase